MMLLAREYQKALEGALRFGNGETVFQMLSSLSITDLDSIEASLDDAVNQQKMRPNSAAIAALVASAVSVMVAMASIVSSTILLEVSTSSDILRIHKHLHSDQLYEYMQSILSALSESANIAPTLMNGAGAILLCTAVLCAVMWFRSARALNRYYELLSLVRQAKAEKAQALDGTSRP